jgi:hypothetical protein
LQGLACAALAATALISMHAESASAAEYRMLLCAGNVGSNAFGTATNTASAKNPAGIFDFNNFCGPAPDPAGEHAFVRITENQPNGTAGVGAFGDIFWDTPAFVHFRTAGGYTREPLAFNDGWRARFWGVDFANNGVQFLTQGVGVPNEGTQRTFSNTFGPHVWPFGNELDFHRFVFELECVRAAGCDRSGINLADANTFLFTLSDDQNSQVAIARAGSPFLSGGWVKGGQSVNWASADNGSGIHDEIVRFDGSVAYHGVAQCDLASTAASGEFARVFQPCPTGGPNPHGIPFNTAGLSDGAHNLTVCTQDYAQFQGVNGTGGESCEAQTIRVDNTAPDAPPRLEVTSANAARYQDHFDAHWSLPADQGSPIAKVHYEVVDAKGNVVVPEKTASGTNLTQLSGIEGPKQPGDYRLRLWLEDTVGFSGAVSSAPVPHDTVPPAAPQDVSVTPPDTSRSANGFDVRWRNLTDAGSPINAAHYQVLDHSGQVVVPTQTIGGEGVQAIPNLDAPSGRGEYSLRLWLSDAEGNVGAPASVPLAYECQRSDIATGTGLDAGIGKEATAKQVVQEGEGSILKGKLADKGGAGVSGASLCVFSRVVTDKGREFLGLAVSGADGRFQFAIPAGASRDLSVDYRSDHRELSSEATIETVVHPTFKAKKKVVFNKHAAVFVGQIPGPDNDRVVVVLQVKRGKGWLAFRRYRTRANGKFSVKYLFHQTTQPTKYIMRAQVRQTVGYPYLQGNSKPITLIVRPR